MSDSSSKDDIVILDYTPPRSLVPLESTTSEPNLSEREMTLSETVTSITNDSVQDIFDHDPVIEFQSLAIDSFLPLIQCMESRNIYKGNDGKYYLRGLPSKHSIENLRTYAQSVTKITLNMSYFNVAPCSWIRLLQLVGPNNKSGTLFPSLKTLVIDIQSNQPSPFLLLSLFLVKTLEALEVISIPEAQNDAFMAYFLTLADVAPNLSQITLGRSIPYNTDIHDNCTKFTSLRKLHLGGVSPEIGLKTLQTLGQLPQLETLILDTLYDSESTHVPREPSEYNDTAPPTVYDHFQPSFGFGSPMPGSPGLRAPSPAPSNSDISETDAMNRSPAKEVGTLPSPAVGFNKLITLHISAGADLTAELVNLISSASLAEVSFTLLHSPVLSIAPPVQLNRTREVIGKKKKKGNQNIPIAAQDSFVGTAIADDSEAACFQIMLQRVFACWAQSLATIKIRDSVFVDEPRHTLDESILQSLLRLSCVHSLRHLEISGWSIESDLGDALRLLNTFGQPSNFESLHLPIDVGTKGISLNRLRGILDICPSITSLQIGFKHLSNVPPYPEKGLTFAVKTLRVGNPVAHHDRRRLMEVAQYLDALCPNLEEIRTQEGCNAEQWKEISELVQMCRFSRSHHGSYTEKI